MHIERVQIEEGFLDGLDVTFTSGLNTLIGERGTGKTSLIELVRFCLGVDGYTADSTKRSRNHALSVLGSGQVTVTMMDGERRVIVTRNGDDEEPRASEPFSKPIILSQTEIETVGLKSDGRLRLIDSFIGDQREANTKEAMAASEVRSLTAEAEALHQEIEELAKQVKEIPVVEKQISDLLPKEQELSKVSSAANDKKTNLDAISSDLAASAVRVGVLERFHKAVSNWQSSLLSVSSSAPTVELVRSDEEPDSLINCRSSVQRASEYIAKAVENLNQSKLESQSLLQTLHENRIKTEDQARLLRKEIEALQEGAGAIARQGQQYRERKAQLNSLNAVLDERRISLKNLTTKRASALDRLDEIREQRFNARNQVANKLTGTLGPRIRVKAFRAGQFENYAAAIAEALRGSGLQYNELSSMLAQSVSPRELLESADNNDVDLIAEAIGITKDRAARALQQFRESDLGVLATAAVEDTVSLQLLDGTDYKDIGELSTGQRCTVILPLVLRHTDRILIVDQPEDHIDNAFIADTLILSMLNRAPNSQIVFSTHNANIPVLGGANRVVHLGSDGKRGFPILVSDLNDPSVVDAITTVMEGGTEAFKRRASFYEQYEI